MSAMRARLAAGALVVLALARGRLHRGRRQRRGQWRYLLPRLHVPTTHPSATVDMPRSFNLAPHFFAGEPIEDIGGARPRSRPTS